MYIYIYMCIYVYTYIVWKFCIQELFTSFFIVYLIFEELCREHVHVIVYTYFVIILFKQLCLFLCIWGLRKCVTNREKNSYTQESLSLIFPCPPPKCHGRPTPSKTIQKVCVCMLTGLLLACHCHCVCVRVRACVQMLKRVCVRACMHACVYAYESTTLPT